VIEAERSRRLLGESIAVPLAVRRSDESGHNLEVPFGHIHRLSPELREAQVDVELEEIDPRRPPGHAASVRTWSDGTLRLSDVARIRLGPARVPSRDSPGQAIELLLERGYSACEIDFESGFWMDYPFAERLGDLARQNDVALSVHAPLFGFMGHAETSGRKFTAAVGALDRSAGIGTASGAALVVFHPGFLLGRSRQDALHAVVGQLAGVRERLEGKGRAIPFGVEVMGRVRDLGSLDDVLEISSRIAWVRPVLDFAHMHATSDGAFLDIGNFATALARADAVLASGAPFHIHFSDIAFANRNETKHLPYGEGTLRVGPLRDALARFERPATIISESPDEESSQIIKDVLLGLRDDVPLLET
jgi:deoxyribonuclease-4